MCVKFGRQTAPAPSHQVGTVGSHCTGQHGAVHEVNIKVCDLSLQV